MFFGLFEQTKLPQNKNIFNAHKLEIFPHKPKSRWIINQKFGKLSSMKTHEQTWFIFTNLWTSQHHNFLKFCSILAAIAIEGTLWRSIAIDLHKAFVGDHIKLQNLTPIYTTIHCPMPPYNHVDQLLLISCTLMTIRYRAPTAEDKWVNTKLQLSNTV